jgi:TIR domain
MPYQHDIFVSYRRSSNVGGWVQRHFVPRLQACIDNVAPRQISIFCDFQMSEGANWPIDLKNRIMSSSLLATIWSADYFRSSWCMAEWQSFRAREQQLGLFNQANPVGLVYPVRYADGDHFHVEARQTLCNKDFTRLNYPDEVFKTTPMYLDFTNLVMQVADELVTRLATVPPWRNDFPVNEVQPLAPVVLAQAVL